MKDRNSSIELLRIILMGFILIWHTFVHGAGLSRIATLTDWGPKYIDELLLCSVVCIAVNCYIFISGYYGIKFTWRGFFNLIYTALFYSVSISLLTYLFSPISLSKEWIFYMLCPLTGYVWWFFSCYVILYLLSGLINSTLEQITQRQFISILIGIYTFLYLYHLILGKIGGVPIGQICLFIFIYAIGRYAAKFKLGIIENKPLFIWACATICLILLILFAFLCPKLPHSIIWYIYTNGNPLLIISAAAFFFLFKKYKFINKILNSLSVSTLSIYLITDYYLVRNTINNQLYMWYNKNLLLYLGAVLLIICACIIIDRVRIFTFNRLQYHFDSIWKRAGELPTNI